MNEWLSKLKKGDIVYLTKEKCYATIVQPPTVTINGIATIDIKCNNNHIETWFVRLDGTGIDKSQIISQFSDDFISWFRVVLELQQIILKLETIVNNLTTRIELLEKNIKCLYEVNDIC